MNHSNKSTSRIALLGLFVGAIALTAFLTWQFTKVETTEEVPVKTIIANADTNLVRAQAELRQMLSAPLKTAQDSARLGDAQRKVVYIAGVKDAFSSIRQETVRLDKAARQ